jgi:hypothetical protein
VSGELYRDQTRHVEDIKKIVENQQEFILDLISEHKAEVEEKLQIRSRRFSSRQIEKQYQVNSQFKDLAAKIQLALTAKDLLKAKEATDALEEQLEEHEQDLVIADSSPHGWLAVARVRTAKELPKSLRKRLAVVEKDLNQQKQRNGGAGRKFVKNPQQSNESDGRQPNRRFSPEEALYSAAKQIRTGQCTHCHKSGHYLRECPQFWTRVNETREAKAKQPQSQQQED